MKLTIDIQIPKTEWDAILKNDLIIMVDSREKENSHVLGWLDMKEIKYEITKLEVGDYSYKLKANKYWENDLCFSNQILIERKASLEEISGNLADGRTRFENELALIYDNGTKLYMLIENGSMANIIMGEYRTSYGKEAYAASFITFMERYNFVPIFTPKMHSGYMIYNIFKRHFNNLYK